MKKEQRTFQIEYELDWEYSVEISKLKKDLEAIEKLGATHVEINCDVGYDSAYITIDPVCCRIETDKECLKRIGDLEQLQMLKEKYE